MKRADFNRNRFVGVVRGCMVEWFGAMLELECMMLWSTCWFQLALDTVQTYMLDERFERDLG